jgi:hypothetical protein
MELVALVSSGKGSWGQIAGVIKNHDWDNIILVGDDFAKQFTVEKDFEFVETSGGSLMELKDEIMKKMKGKINGTEVGLSIASGSGKEHMALISALLSLPVGIRFTALTKDGLVFM